MLSALGRRIEKLFYLGFALILLCFVEVYFSSAAVFFNQSSETAASFYLEQMESNLKELTQAYENAHAPDNAEKRNKRTEIVTRTRDALGLPPAIPDDDISSNVSYYKRLQTIYESFKPLINPQKDPFSKILSSSSAPNDIIELLRRVRAEELKKNAMVWGIETPRLFSMHYGRTDYTIPAHFLAFASFSALSPIVLAWLGSFYVTRKRELLLIRELHDFRHSFPHILNIFAITFSNLALSLGIHQSRRSQYIERKIGGIVSAFFRSAVVLSISVPMLLCSTYSLYNLYDILPDDNFGILFLGIALLVIYTILCLQILVQESLLLYKKDFYA